MNKTQIGKFYRDEYGEYELVRVLHFIMGVSGKFEWVKCSFLDGTHVSDMQISVDDFDNYFEEVPEEEAKEIIFQNFINYHD